MMRLNGRRRRQPAVSHPLLWLLALGALAWWWVVP